jgi:carbonic anhydrase
MQSPVAEFDEIETRNPSRCVSDKLDATILACSDSRVSRELVYDQHVGDLFVVRNAGNFVTDAVLGTIEYGYSVLKSKLIVVLGHDACGAISATCDAIKSGTPLKPHLDATKFVVSVVKLHRAACPEQCPAPSWAATPSAGG